MLLGSGMPLLPCEMCTVIVTISHITLPPECSLENRVLCIIVNEGSIFGLFLRKFNVNKSTNWLRLEVEGRRKHHKHSEFCLKFQNFSMRKISGEDPGRM